jgi:hypothetical protein
VERPRIAIKGRAGGDDCPYCRDALAGRGAVCATCLAVHHVECWLEHGRCAGCGWTKALMPPEAVPAAPVAPSRAPPEPVPGLKVTPLCDLEEACLLLGAREAEVRGLIAAGALRPRQGGERLLFEREQLALVRGRLTELRHREAFQDAARRRRRRLVREALALGCFGVASAAIPVGGALAYGGPGVGLGVLGFYLLVGVLLLLQPDRRGADRPDAPPAPPPTDRGPGAAPPA